jgi:DNA-binding beta-propeller fold protein YncE
MRWWVFLLLFGCKRVEFPPGANWPAAAPGPWVSRGHFAITDNRSDLISFVATDQPTPEVLANLPVGDVPVELEGPHHLAASPDGKYIYYNLSNYVPGSGSGPHGSHGTGTVPGSLVKLDARTGEPLGEVLVDRSPGDVILSADGKTAYVSHYDLLRIMELQPGDPPDKAFSKLAVVDTATMTRLAMPPVCVTAHGEALSPDGKTLYLTCALSDMVAVVDVSDRTHPVVQKTLPVGPAPGPLGTPAYSPYAVTVAADGTAWVSNNTSGDVRVYDPATGQMDAQRTFFVGGVAMFSAFSADGKVLYVPHQGDDQLAAIDVGAKTLKQLPLAMNGACFNAHAFVLDPSSQTGVVVCEGDHLHPGTVVRVTLSPFVVTGFVEVGVFPDGAAWLPASS